MSDLFGSSKEVTEALAPVVTEVPGRNLSVKFGGRNALSTTGGGTNVNVGFGASGLRKIISGPVRSSLRDSRRRIGGVIDRLNANENPFIQARVRPAEQAQAERVADVTRGLGRRNVTGSLATNEINKTRFLGDQFVNDQRAIATDETLSALLNAESSIRGLNQDETQMTEILMRDELARLGLGAELLRMSMPQTFVSGGGTSTRTSGDVLGTIGDIVTLGSTFASSDRRLKRDIHRVGEQYGLPLYTFRYLWSDTLYRGYMADEVEALYPEAVAWAGGYASVNYPLVALLGEEARDAA